MQTLHRFTLPAVLVGVAAVLTSCGAGGESGSTSLTDTNPPQPGQVNDGFGADVDAQVNLDTIAANWNGFTDDSGTIAEYRWAIGTTSGGTELMDWTSAGTATQGLKHGLTMTVGMTIFVSVRALDQAGNISQPATSDGNTIISGQNGSGGGGGGGGGNPSPGVMASSVSQFGITWSFAQPCLTGQFCNGDYWVVGPVSIVEITPHSQDVGGRIINGSMVNPVTVVNGEHGYDSALFHPYEDGRYHPELNVATGISQATPLVLDHDKSLISVVSYMGASPAANGSFSQLSTAAVLTVLAAAPPEGAFRPAYAGTDKTVHFTEADLDYGTLGNLPPATGMPDLAQTTAAFERVWLDHMSGWTSRYMHPIDNMPDYGRDFTSLYGTGVLTLQTNLTTAQKRLLLIRTVQIGIDFFGNVQAGAFWQGVGGQGSGRKFPIVFAGAVLHDPAMQAIGATNPSGYYGPNNPNNRSSFGEDCQTFYVEQTAPGEFNWGFGGYNATYVGLPEWGNRHTHETNQDNAQWGGDPYRRCCTANAWVGQTLSARVMGLQTIWAHPSYFDYMDRYMQTEAVGDWTRSWEPWQAAMWDTYRQTF